MADRPAPSRPSRLTRRSARRGHPSEATAQETPSSHTSTQAQSPPRAHGHVLQQGGGGGSSSSRALSASTASTASSVTSPNAVKRSAPLPTSPSSTFRNKLF